MNPYVVYEQPFHVNICGKYIDVQTLRYSLAHIFADIPEMWLLIYGIMHVRKVYALIRGLCECAQFGLV